MPFLQVLHLFTVLQINKKKAEVVRSLSASLLTVHTSLLRPRRMLLRGNTKNSHKRQKRREYSSLGEVLTSPSRPHEADCKHRSGRTGIEVPGRKK